LRFVLGKMEGTKHLNVPGFEERIILNGSSINGSNVDWDDLSLEGDFSGCCENHSETLDCMKCVELLD